MKDDIQDFVNNFLKSNPDQMGRVLPFTRPDDSTHEQLQDAKDINTCIDKISKVAEEMEKYFATKGDELGFAKWTMALCILSGTGIGVISKSCSNGSPADVAQHFINVLTYQINNTDP